MKRSVLLVLVILAVAAGLASAPPIRAQTGPRIGQPAPEITGGPWINSPPLSMEKLRGRVVFIEFWTYG